MKAMIMAAGVGSRLMPITTYIPKPMIPVANKPVMEIIVELLHKYGFNNIICNLHHLPECIITHFEDGAAYGVSMEYSLESVLMGTAGGVKKCEWFLDETFLIISGDVLTDINLDKLVNEHKQKGALATIALKEVTDVERFGIVITDENGLIQSFQEKPHPDQALGRMANTGIYIFEPEIFKYIPSNLFYDFGKQLFPDLIKARCPFYAVNIDEYWCDVGSIEAYLQANADVLTGRVTLQMQADILKGQNNSRVLVGTGTDIGNNVSFTGNVILGSNCKIGDRSTIADSVIWDGTVIEADSIIERAITGYDNNPG